MSKMNITKILHYVSALLLIVLLVLQFMPYWHYGTGEKAADASISEYVWLPSDHKNLTKALEKEYDDYSINNIILPPILVLVLGAVGVVMGVVMAGKALAGIIPALCGVAGLWGWLTMPIFNIQSEANAVNVIGSSWITMVVLMAAVLVVGVASLFTIKKKAA